MYVKGKIEDAGRDTVGTKVTLADLDIDFRNQSVTITNLQIPDPDNLWENMFEIRSANFDFSLGDLLMGHYVIDNLSADTPRWGTKRDSWGGLKKSDKKPSPESELLSTLGIDWKQYLPAPNIPKDFDVKEIVKPEKMKSVKLAEYAKTEFVQKGVAWKEKAKEYETELKVAAVAVAAITIASLADIDKAKKEIEKVDALKKKVASARDEIQKDIDSAKGSVKKIELLRKDDLENILNISGLGGEGLGGLTQKIFGEAYKGKISKLVTGMKIWAIQALGLPEEGKGRMEGTTIKFPLYRPLPKFFMKRAELTSFSEKREGKWFAGTLTELSSDQKVTGKPLLLDIEYGNEKFPGAVYSIDGKIDKLSDEDELEIKMNVTGITANMVESSLGPDSPISMTGGNVTADFSLNVKGETITSDFVITLNDITTSARREALGHLDNKVVSILDRSLNKITYINLKGEAKGKIGDLEMRITSDIDKIMQKVVDAAVEEARDELERLVREELDRQLEKLTPEITALLINENGNLRTIDGALDEIMEKFEDEKQKLEKQAQEEIDNAKKKLKEEEKKARKRLKEEEEKAAKLAEEEKKKAEKKIAGEKAEADKKLKKKKEDAKKAGKKAKKEIDKQLKELKLPKF
jgi:uncharacterized protein (TIGR03545 family)